MPAAKTGVTEMAGADIEVEQVERHLEYVLVGIEPNHRDSLDAFTLEAPGQIVRQTGVTWIRANLVFGGEARECRNDFRTDGSAHASQLSMRWNGEPSMLTNRVKSTVLCRSRSISLEIRSGTCFVNGLMNPCWTSTTRSASGSVLEPREFSLELRAAMSTGADPANHGLHARLFTVNTRLTR